MKNKAQKQNLWNKQDYDTSKSPTLHREVNINYIRRNILLYLSGALLGSKVSP